MRDVCPDPSSPYLSDNDATSSGLLAKDKTSHSERWLQPKKSIFFTLQERTPPPTLVDHTAPDLRSGLTPSPRRSRSTNKSAGRAMLSGVIYDVGRTNRCTTQPQSTRLLHASENSEKELLALEEHSVGWSVRHELFRVCVCLCRRPVDRYHIFVIIWSWSCGLQGRTWHKTAAAFVRLRRSIFMESALVFRSVAFRLGEGRSCKSPQPFFDQLPGWPLVWGGRSDEPERAICLKVNKY